jgi:hexokinase
MIVMNLERNSGNINFGMNVGANLEVSADAAEYDRNWEEAQAREKLASVMTASETPEVEPAPVQHEKLTGAAILQLVNRRGQNLQITRSRAAGADQQEAA